MGRAIEMENNIDALKIKVERLENTMRGMCAKLDELDEAIFDYEEDKTSMERAADAEEIVEENKTRTKPLFKNIEINIKRRKED